MFADVSTNRIKENHSRFLSLIGLQGQILLAEHTHHQAVLNLQKRLIWAPKGRLSPFSSTEPLYKMCCVRNGAPDDEMLNREESAWDKHLHPALLLGLATADGAAQKLRAATAALRLHRESKACVALHPQKGNTGHQKQNVGSSLANLNLKTIKKITAR